MLLSIKSMDEIIQLFKFGGFYLYVLIYLHLLFLTARVPTSKKEEVQTLKYLLSITKGVCCCILLKPSKQGMITLF